MIACRRGLIGLLIVLGFAASGTREASAGFLVGSSFRVVGQNSPTSFTEDVTLAPGTSLIDGGRLSLTQSFVQQGGGDWLTLAFQTTAGLLSPSLSNYWELGVQDVRFDTPAYLSAVMLYFTIDGEPAGPLRPFSTFRPVLPNPLDPLGRDAYLAYYDSPPILGSFGQTPWARPYAALSAGGLDLSRVNGVVMGFKITSVASPVPEPAAYQSAAIGASVLAGILLGRSRRRRGLDPSTA